MGAAFLPLGCSKLQRAREGNGLPQEHQRGSPLPEEKPWGEAFRETTGGGRLTSDLLGSSMTLPPRSLTASEN